MKGHLGAVLTSGLAAVALALALLQAAVLLHAEHHRTDLSPARAETNRYSAPGGRSGVPWLPVEKKQKEERHSPPPPRQRSYPPPAGPRPARRATA